MKKWKLNSEFKEHAKELGMSDQAYGKMFNLIPLPKDIERIDPELTIRGANGNQIIYGMDFAAHGAYSAIVVYRNGKIIMIQLNQL